MARRALPAVLAAALLAVVVLLPVEAGEAPAGDLVRVKLPDPKAQLPALAAAGLDVAGVDLEAGTVDLVVTPAQAEALVSDGFEVEVIRPAAAPGVEVDTQYLDPGEVEALLASLEAQHPGLMRVDTLGFSEEGRAYRAVKVSDNVMVEEDEPAIFFIAQHHAREVMTPEVATDLIVYLLGNYATDPEVAAWVDGTEIWVIPVHNPDGADHVFTVYDLWRKNRRDNGDGTFGVDPNRNYPYRWGACNGSSGITSDPLYRGPFPASEPETAFLMSLALEQRPVLALTYHSYGELVIYPYGCDGSIPPDQNASEMVGQRLARTLGRDSGSGFYRPGYGWAILYGVDGEMSDWFYAALGTFGYTVEMNASAQGFLPGYAAWRDSTVQRNRPGWQHLLRRLEGASARGHVRDACTAAPLEAAVEVLEVPLSLDESDRTSEPVWGRYQRLLELGDYTLRFSKGGYLPQVWETAVRTSPSDRDVHLVPAGSRAVEAASWTLDDSEGDGDGRLDPGEEGVLRLRARATGETVSGLTATLGTTDPYAAVLDGDAAYPDLPAGGEAEPSDGGFQVRVDASAPPGHRASFNLGFAAGEPLCRDGGPLEVPITAAVAACPWLLESLDADPGWSITNSTAGGWAFGSPMALPGGLGPGSAATGANVYGTNLGGNYLSNATYILTSSPFDLTGLTGTTLVFWRWLSAEEGYDYASVEGTADGVTWRLLWTGTASDRSWRHVRLDASALDGAPSARFRFTLKTDYSVVSGGFYLDDVAVCGERVPPRPRLVGQSLAVHADDGNPACGDGDGAADGAEIVTLRATVENLGTSTAMAATATLRSLGPTVEILSGPAALGDLPPGMQGTGEFLARVSSGASCGEPAGFRVDLTAAGTGMTTDSLPSLTLEVDGAACDANTCPSACTPTATVEGLLLGATGRLAWISSADPCHALAGIGYRVYRSGDPAPAGTSPEAFPGGTAFADVSLQDDDGSLLDAGFDDPGLPPPGGVFHYLVADVGTDGNRGPLGHYGN